MLPNNMLFKKLMIVLISFNLIVTQSISAATGIGANERTEDISIDMIRSGEPSDLPIAGVEDFFEKEHFSFIQNFDLSSFAGKQIFVGYGVYDKDQENCKYLEVPGVAQDEYDSQFRKFGKFNMHSYGVTPSPMTYSQCKAKAESLGGTPVVIDNIAEATYVSHAFLENATDQAWVGAIAESNCYDYTNALGRAQDFFNWSTDEIGGSLCGNTNGTLGSKKNISMKQNASWLKVSSGLYKYCVVEWDSEDYKRPIKMCAPWWKVVREFENKAPGLYDTNDLKRINQADIPINLHICTLYQSDISTTSPDEGADRQVTCTSYYSRTEAPECLRDIKQPQCEVDECGGYIKNVCTHVEEETVGKGYVKGELLIDGVMQSVKLKDDIKTHLFNCPAPHVSDEYCLEKGTVVAYPQECSGSQCSLLKDCLLSPTTTSQAQIDQCYTDHPCEKIYPSRDFQPLVIGGEVRELYGKCSSGEILTFIPNIQNKDKKTCVEYELTTITENYKQKCVKERPYTEISVDAGITDTDDYEGNDLCVRMDTATESQEATPTTFKINSNNYFLNRITKVNFDGTTELVYAGSSQDYILGGALADASAALNPTADPGATEDTTEIEVIYPGDGNITTTEDNETVITGTPLVDCSAYDPSSPTVSAWYSKNTKLFLESSSSLDPNIFSDGEYLDGGTMKVRIADNGSVIATNTDCQDYALNHEFGSYKTSATWTQNAAGENTCYINLSSIGPDSEMKQIKFFSSTEAKYVFKNNLSKEDCREKAICLNGTYNEGDFASLTDVQECIVVVDGSGSPERYQDEIREENGLPVYDPSTAYTVTDGDCKPTSTEENAGSSVNLDSIESIVMIEDLLDGGFGYYANFNQWYAKNNSVTVSYDSEVDKKAFPFIDISMITDGLKYHYEIYHISYLKKEPDVGLAAGAAAGAGVATAATMYALIAVGLATGPIGWIVAVVVVIVFAVIMLLGPPKKMDNQFMVWIIYKKVPASKYIEGPYEKRVKMTSDLISEYHLDRGYKNTLNKGGVPIFDISPDYTLMYLTSWYVSNIVERNDYLEYINDQYQKKAQSLSCAGYSKSAIDSTMTHNAEKSIIWGYPSCEWYKPWCEKSDSRTPIVGDTDTYKYMTTVYLGAVNTLVVLLPYAGDYKVQAYDKYDELLAENIIHKDTFVQAGGVENLKFAKVNFGLLMQPSTKMLSDATTIVASNDSMGETSGACRADQMVEWGGGVSGIYYEAETTGLNSSKCYKSDDNYVKDRSMTKIKVTPLNLEDGFEFTLTKPMPYPNRVFLGTMDKLAKRNYRCYDDFPECTEDDFATEGE